MLRQRFVRQLSVPARDVSNINDNEIFIKYFNKINIYTSPGGICRTCKGSGWVTCSNNNNNTILFHNMFKFDLCKDCNGTGLN
tara:strand:+ start:858 stop:1106 length:249 start_codon:yes stop_codon:yes gene_type:complete